MEDVYIVSPKEHHLEIEDALPRGMARTEEQRSKKLICFYNSCLTAANGHNRFVAKK